MKNTKPTYLIIERIGDEFFAYTETADHYANVMRGRQRPERKRRDLSVLDVSCNLSDELSDGEWFRVDASNLMPVTPQKVKRSPIKHRLVPMNVIDDARNDADVCGWGFSYRNRAGKQYVTYTGPDTYNIKDTIRAFFPRALCTSSSPDSRTYRINP